MSDVSPRKEPRSGALVAQAAQLDHRAHVGEAVAVPRLAQGARQLVVVEVRRLAAIVADQEDAVVQAPGVRIGEIGVGALDSVGEVGAHEQVEDAVDAVRSDALAATLPQFLGDVVGRRRPVRILCG